ncbi:hypothetical protein H5410_031644 [Solanum commersonii]|uniref:Ubiquitin-like protease family profile domain-containing protein n=1 Tax=Solanum commersonii TaxID=4109 RepID=A0A9J5YIV8_SOLCO|nr:hypothetical protein H5410_031644 [Solanum commersonii]
MSQPNQCWTDEHVHVILYYLRKKSKQPSEVYVLVNCNGEFHWVLVVVVLKQQCIKVYDSMSSSSTNRKLSTEIQKLPTILLKYLESSELFEQKDRTNWSVLESYQDKNRSYPFEVIHVTGIAQQTSNSLVCGLFVATYAEILSDGLQVPSYGIISQSLRMRYASILWNYGRLRVAMLVTMKTHRGLDLKKTKFICLNKNVMVITID